MSRIREQEEIAEKMEVSADQEIPENSTEAASCQFSPFEQKAMDGYDEDLSTNGFFQSLLASCPDLFSQCVQEQWLICVARRDSLPKYAFTFEDFTHHILRPLDNNKDAKKGKTGGRHWSGGSSCSGFSVSSLLQAPSSCESFDSAPGGEDQISNSFITAQALENEANGKAEACTLRGNWNYQTLTHINVEFTGQTLILDVEVPIRMDSSSSENNNASSSDTQKFVQLRKEVLFEETFYTHDRRKYKVLCVSSPLNSKVDIEDEGFGNAGLGLWNLTSLRDCIDFIWVKGGFKILESYDLEVKLFLHNHSGLENLPLAIQRNLVKGLFLKCVEYSEGAGMTTTVPENPTLSDFLLQRLRLATETYICNGVYRSLISAITSVTTAEDAFINKITRNLHDIHPEDLDIQMVYWNVLGRARHELSRISSYSSPLGKLSCLKKTIRHLRACSVTADGGGDASTVLTTNELIPIWTYLLIKNPIGNWIAQLEFLRNFRFSSDEQPDNENSFYIVTMEASLEHLKSGKVLGSSYHDDNDDDNRDISSPFDLGEAWLYNLHQDAYESDNPQLAEMFEMIRLGKCGRLEELIEEYEVERYEFNKMQKKPREIDPALLCHPLCQCGHCSTLYQSIIKTEPMARAVDLTTDEGLTCLHVACIYGRPKVVDILIGSGSNLNQCDTQGMTALHYASSRGHQNALLLLVHAGCDLQPLNNTQNTPLHLAAQNGHEGCVKALIYYAEQVGRKLHLSSGNIKGDTPLHFASRWGFIGIVKILTEHGASITTPNIRHATAIDCAHDIHILRILQRSLRRRSLVQSDHGDYVNIEMMHKDDHPGIIMLISEPTIAPSPQQQKFKGDVQNTATSDHQSLENNNDSSTSKSNTGGSRASSRRGSISSGIPPNLLQNSIPRSRKISAMHYSPNDSNPSITEVTEKCLKTVAQHLTSTNDPSSSDFVINYPIEYDPTEQEHLRTIQVEKLDDLMTLQDIEAKKARDVFKLFATIAVGDVPLSLFYLGIPAQEIDNCQNELNLVNVISPCHPLCPCHKCAAKNAGLGLGLNIQNQEGLSPLHMAVQCHILVLVKILLRYGADINLQSTFEKKTALDYAIEKGFHDIEDILLAAGAAGSTCFCPAASDECEQ